MIIDLAEWLFDHWQEVTFNTLLLFILRKFILTELKRLLRFSRNDAILSNQKVLMRELGVESEWTSHEHGLNFTVLANSKKWLPIFTKVIRKQKSISRRKNMLANIVKAALTANLSKKLLSVLVSMGITSLNYKYHLNIPEEVVWGILGLSMSHITLQTIIDSIKAYVSHKYIQPATTVISSGTSNIKWDNLTFKEAAPFIQIVHNGINNLLTDVKRNDGSQAAKDAMRAYNEIEVILDAYKKTEPLPEVTERQESA